ncbi:His-Xaa-Ser system protein HxsD [Pedobacter sp. GR22-6]|uniref:His-Xaa-Ser system protein HxsD n=1 Tax=Pedobacter sp. GR22-6 TaxID=3127957 RepID=UPI00307DD0BF
MNYKLTDQVCMFSIDKAIYSIETIHKCFYWYTGDFDVDINSDGESIYQVTMSPKTNTDCDFAMVIERVKQNLIDFKLREIVNKETQTIRELIVAKAFANYEMEAEMPKTEVSDPVGFNPALI